MKNYILIIVLLALSANSWAQSETILGKKFYDIHNNIVDKSEYPHHYREVIRLDKSIYKVQDIAIDGQVLMSCVCMGKRLKYTELFEDWYTIYRHGKSTRYYKSGSVYNIGMYVNGCKDGEWKYYYDGTGQEKRVSIYDTCRAVKTTYYYKNGDVQDKRNYKYEGKLSPSMAELRKGYLDTFFNVDGKMIISNIKYAHPSYNLNQSLGKKIALPGKEYRKGIREKVWVKYLIDKEGYIKTMEPAKRFESAVIMKSVMEGLSTLPKWKPATKNDRLIEMFFTLPVSVK